MKSTLLNSLQSKQLAKLFLLVLMLLAAFSGFSQPGKDGALTISTTNTVLNRYTRVTADVPVGSSSVTVSNIAELNRDGIGYLPTGYVTNASGFSSNTLQYGDLILLFQAQGATINTSNSISYGDLTSFNNAGKYELAYVGSVSGNTITLNCKTRFAYFAANYVQCIRIPQYTTLTVNNGASVVPIKWGDPAFGGANPSAVQRRRGGFLGILANDLVNDGSINANAAGFRGGTFTNGSVASGDVFYKDYYYNVFPSGGEKGESIAGYRTDYDALGGRYGMGAPANGGGGGNGHNCGGGGGANGGDPSGWFRGAGVMNHFGTCGNPGAWTLDPNYIANGNALTNSAGGGHGGYSYSSANANACTVGPSYPADFISPGVPLTDVLPSAWGGDKRKAFGGLGGHPLISPAIDRQIFFGGGGGAGDGNNNAANDGGDGGGVVFVVVENTITGNGVIQANGENGANTQGAVGNDAPGGGGGGGTVLVQASSVSSGITVNANGGTGGSQFINLGNEGEGVAGGGGGGAIYMNATTDASTKTVSGGANGTTNSLGTTEFIANGATSGNTGSISSILVIIDFTTCLTDLEIIKTVDELNPVYGSDVTFTLTANNLGQNDATGVRVTDLLSSGYHFVSATPSVGTYDYITGEWTIGNLVNGASATLSIVATVNLSGDYSNTATISANETDPVLTNNTSTVTPVPTDCTVGTASSTPTLCINSALTPITHATTGATGIGTPTGLPTGVSASWAADEITISGTPTVSGTFNYSIPLTSCGSLVATGTIVVQINTATSPASSSICVNSALTPITITTTLATGIGSATGLPSGVTASWSSNVITISGTPTASGTFNYSIPLTGGCGSVNATGTITVTNIPNTVSAPSSTLTTCNINTAITQITHTTTQATGIGTPTGLPPGISAVWSANVIRIFGAPTATGIYNYSIPLTGGCGSVNATGTMTINGPTTGGATVNLTTCLNVAITTITRNTTFATSIGTPTGLPPGITASWSANVLTLSGTPTVEGTYNYSIPVNGPCSNTTNTGTLTVVSANLPGTASSNPTLCINTALTPITRTTGAATGIGTPTGLPAGVSASWSNNVITVTGTPTESGTFNYTIPLTGGCGSVDATGTITVNPLNTVDNNGITTTLCINTALSPVLTHNTTGATGISNITGLPTGVSASWSANVITISGTPTTSGSSSYTIRLSGGCGTVNATGTIVRTATNTVGNATGGNNRTLCINTALTPFTRTTTGATGIANDGVSGANGLPAGVSATWSANTLTISGTPTASGSFPYTIPLTGGCGTVNATGTITVTVANTVSAASASPTLCINTALTSFTHTTTGATGISNNNVTGANGLPAGVRAVFTGNATSGTITISGTPTASGTFNYSIPLTGGCVVSPATGTIVVTPANTAGTVSANPTLCVNTALTPITRTTTGATGIGTATGLPAGVSAAWSANTLTVSGTPTASGTFNYSVPLTGGCGTVNATGTITSSLNTAGTASSNPTICINTALTAITRTTTGATGIGTATGLPTGVSAAWSANTLTVSGTPTQSGTFNYTIPLTGGCGSVNATGTITVTAANTVGTASSTPTLCINTALTAITHTTTGATGRGTATGLPAGVTSAWAGNVLTISGTPTASGTFNYSIPLTGGCGSVSATGTITVTAANTVGAASSTPTLCINTALTAITHTTTGATGRGTATGLPAGVTSAWSGNTLTISGTPTASGTFNYSIPLTGGCGSVNATGTITVTAANTAGAASSSPTLCVNTVLTAITHSTTGATGRGTATGLPSGVTSSWSANVLTISGTPTATGTFNYSIPLTGGCGSINATGTITVVNANTAGTASSNPTLCINTALTAITRTTGAATGIGTPTGLPTGVSAAWSANVITVSGTPTQSGTFNYSIPLTGGCGSVNATGTITVSPLNIAGAASSTPTVCQGSAITAITHSTTNATGIGSATGLPTGVSASWSANVITISGTPSQSGTFNYSIPLTGGCGSVNATGTITVTATNTAGTASSNPSICINTALTAITRTTTGATGIGTATGLPTGVSASWSANTLTVSGTPTQSGTFNYTIPLTGGCGSVNATGTITVVTSNSVSSPSDNPTTCINTSITPITFTTGGATGIGSATGLPTGVSASWSGNTITISGTPTVNGVYNYSIPLTGGCSSVDATGTITVVNAVVVGAASSSPTLCINTALTAITHTTTNASGIGAATGLPTGVSASWSSNTITISGTPTVSGTFNYTIPATGSCGSVDATGTIIVSPANSVGSASSTPTLCINTALTAITHSTTNATGIGSPTGLPTGVSASWSADVITISGTPTASGTFNYSIPLSGGCGAINATGTIIVTSANSAGSASSSPNLCVNTALTDITHSTTGATGIGSPSGLPTGVSASWLGNVVTISGTPTQTGTFNYSIPLSGGCSAINATGTITVSGSSVAGTVSGNTQACYGNGSTLLTLTGYTGSIQWQSSTNNSTFSNISGETGATYTASNLLVTTYYRAVVTSGNCSAATSSSFTVTVVNPSVSASLSSGDYVWRGSDALSTDSVDWLVPSNWYVYDGSNFALASTLPTKDINVFIPGVGTCFRANPHIFTSTAPVSKNLTILSSGHLTMHTGKLSVAGNWVNNGIFTCGTGEVIFIEQGYHTIGGTVSVNAFYDFRMNKPADGGTKGVAYLLKQATISGSMTLDLGLFDINVFSIDMDGRPVIGGSPASYVRTSSTGFLRRVVHIAEHNADGIHVRYPIGRSNYNPAHLQNSGTHDIIGVRVFDKVTDDSEEASPLTTLPAVERTWMIEEGVVGGSVVDMQLYWNGTLEARIEEINSFDYNTAYIAHYDYSGVTWEDKGGSAPGGPGYAQQNGITSFSPFTISSKHGLGYISPLPVELIDFKATCLEDKTVRIDWNTASENNSNYYDVMKSTNGTSWKVLENVPAAGNSNSLLNYQVFDRELSFGNVYYKLKQVDIDGKFKMYDVINTNCDESITEDNLNAYPNPSLSEFNIDFNSVNIEGEGKIVITDSKGLVIYSRKVQIEKGSNFFTIDELKASPGLYYISLTSNKFTSNIVKHIIR